MAHPNFQIINYKQYIVLLRQKLFFFNVSLSFITNIIHFEGDFIEKLKTKPTKKQIVKINSNLLTSGHIAIYFVIKSRHSRVII